MRFGVSARRLEGQRLGIGRYIEYMLKSWEKMLAPTDRMLVRRTSQYDSRIVTR